MTPNGIVALGAVLGGVAVAVGAFGAHGLQGRVSPEMLNVFEVGVRYQMYHALALVLLGLFAGRGPSPTPIEVPPGVAPAAWLFLAGIVLFSGSLYALVLTGTRWLGAITPLGGVSFLAGWAMFARAALLRS
ncbi:MAG: DUF423 domain-containing protein [Deltaproteobacteria bacterium]|nr:DUF423 domain-containing protein [Deltaproteobacteria bacterium]